MAGLPQVGLEAIIQGMAQFQASANAITKAYDDINAKANVVQSSTSSFGSAFSSLSSSIGSISGQFVGLGQGVMRFGAIAGGVALAGVTALGAGIVALGVSAVGEFAKYERMSLSIQNLVAREISQGQVVEQQIQTRIGLTQKETEELSKLPQKITDETLSRKTLAAQIQEQQQKIIQLTAAYGENGLNVQVAKGRLAEMENEYNKSGTAIDTLNGRLTELNSKNNDLTTTLQKVRVGQMSMSDAMIQAAPKAQELLKWIQLLAIQSPFNQEGIANAFQTAMAYGFTADEAKRLTQAEVDFAAATGKSVEATNLIALALGQMQAKGKVSGQEIIQLTNAGVGVNKILADMGFTLDDVSKGLVDSDKFIQAVIADMEVFKGAAKDQATTFAGLIASLEDLKSIGLREFFTGTFKAIQPYLINFVNFLTDAALSSGSIRSLGDALGQSVGTALATISNLVVQFQRWGPEGIFAAMGFKSSSLFIASVKTLFDLIAGQLPSAQSMFDGFSSTIAYLQANLFPMLTQAVSFVIDHFVEFKGALIGIGAILGTGVFAALVAGLFSLLTPINLIIAASAALGAAWAGDWLGIATAVTNAVGLITSEIGLLSSAFQVGGLDQLGVTIATQLQNIWTTYIFPQLAMWGTNFMNWVTAVYPQIPQKLTELVTAITSGLIAGWDLIAPGLATWVPKFWNWVDQAIGGASTALGALLTAMYTWATSGAGQASLQSLGAAIGKITIDYLAIAFQNVGPASNAIFKLIGALAVGVASATGLLIVIGGTIVSGILAGILNSLGIDLKPATFNELSGILTGIGANILIIAQTVGKNIVDGIVGGIQAYQQTLETSMITMIQGAINAFTSFLGMASPSTVFYDFGINIIQGLINGIVSMAGQVGTTITGILGGILGGGTALGGGGALGGLTFDPATMLANLTLVSQQIALINSGIANISTISLPGLSVAFVTATGLWLQQFPILQQQILALDLGLQNISVISLPGLSAAFMLVSGLWLQQIPVVQQQILALDLGLQNISTVSLPTLQTVMMTSASVIGTALLSIRVAIISLQTTTITSAGTMGTAILSIGPAVVSITNLVSGLSSTVTSLKNIATTTANGIKQEFSRIDWKSVGAAIGNGIMDGLKSKANEIKRLAEKVAEDALEAAKRKLGISSPSKLFYEVGQEIVNGMTQGILSLSGDPVKAATDMVDGIFGALSPAEVGNQMSQFAQAFSSPLLTNLQKTIDDSKKALTESLSSLSGQLGRTIGTGDLEKLKNTLWDLPVSEAVPIVDNISLALNAQNKLNSAMEQQVKVQEQINALQTQQQQFTFLQKQIELIDFLTKQGLNAADVLKGIPLGISASATDLLSAMQATIEVSIAKMNQQLGGLSGGTGFRSGIGFAAGNVRSANLKPTEGLFDLGTTIPSGYPNDSFGPMYAQSGEQMLITPKGLSIDELISQRLSSVIGNINAPVTQTPTIGTHSTTNSTVNNFQMTVNSGASPQAVIQTFNVAKAMLT